jgi:hypothetical protein
MREILAGVPTVGQRKPLPRVRGGLCPQRFPFASEFGNISTYGSEMVLRLKYGFPTQPVCSLFYLQSITIIPIIITTAIHAAHMT